MNFPNIIYEDENLLVVDKPAGLVVNKSETTKDITLEDLLIEKYNLTGSTTEFEQRKGIVHRLDKDTSGVLLIAKDERTYEEIKAQFMDRDIAKEYIALVYGEVKDKEFEIAAPIGRNPENKRKMIVSQSGKTAVTKFELIKNIKLVSGDYALLKVLPKTGRTHQIRVHLAAYGHSVVGDVIYVSSHVLSKSASDFSRMMLHAKSIEVFYRDEKRLFVSTSYSDFDL